MTSCRKTKRFVQRNIRSVIAVDHLDQVWIDVLIGSETLVDLCHVIEKGEKGKGGNGSRGRNRGKYTGTSSDAASEDSVESELGGDVNTFQTRVKKRDRDSDDFIPSARKRKVA
jgi:hypothetical protein